MNALMAIICLYIVNTGLVSYAFMIAKDDEYNKKWKLAFDLAIPFGIMLRFVVEGLGDVISVFKEMFQFLTKK